VLRTAEAVRAPDRRRRRLVHGRPWRGARPARAQRCRQDERHQDAAGPRAPGRRRGAPARPPLVGSPVPQRRRVPPRAVPLPALAHRRRGAGAAREAGPRRRRCVRAARLPGARRARQPRGRPGRRVLEGHAAAARARRRAGRPAGTRRPRRADQRPGPARPGRRPRPRALAEVARRRRAPELPPHRRGGAGVRPGGDPRQGQGRGVGHPGRTARAARGAAAAGHRRRPGGGPAAGGRHPDAHWRLVHRRPPGGRRRRHRPGPGPRPGRSRCAGARRRAGADQPRGPATRRPAPRRTQPRGADVGTELARSRMDTAPPVAWPTSASEEGT
jgi:translation initiation factor IF-2